MTAKKLLFSDLFSWVFLTCTWTGHVATLLRAGRCGRESWIGCAGSQTSRNSFLGELAEECPCLKKLNVSYFNKSSETTTIKLGIWGHSVGPMIWSSIQVSNVGDTIEKVKGRGKAWKNIWGWLLISKGATSRCFLFLSAATFVLILKRGIITHAKVLWSCAGAVLQSRRCIMTY